MAVRLPKKINHDVANLTKFRLGMFVTFVISQLFTIRRDSGVRDNYLAAAAGQIEVGESRVSRRIVPFGHGARVTDNSAHWDLLSVILFR